MPSSAQARADAEFAEFQRYHAESCKVKQRLGKKVPARAKVELALIPGDVPYPSYRPSYTDQVRTPRRSESQDSEEDGKGKKGKGKDGDG